LKDSRTEVRKVEPEIGPNQNMNDDMRLSRLSNVKEPSEL